VAIPLEEKGLPLAKGILVIPLLRALPFKPHLHPFYINQFKWFWGFIKV
tara:strand:+ start:405 stop:551 length:147 start_codon:yes stop_codon:yes gene_type:complete